MTVQETLTILLSRKTLLLISSTIYFPARLPVPLFGTAIITMIVQHVSDRSSLQTVAVLVKESQAF